MSKKFKSPNPVGPYSMFKELSSGGWIHQDRSQLILKMVL